MGGKKIIKKKEYPYWKKLAWNFFRAGLWGGLASAFSIGIVLQPDLSNIKVYLSAIIAAFVTGFMFTAGKYIRDNVSENYKL